jgi:hypothetical protein
VPVCLIRALILCRIVSDSPPRTGLVASCRAPVGLPHRSFTHGRRREGGTGRCRKQRAGPSIQPLNPKIRRDRTVSDILPGDDVAAARYTVLCNAIAGNLSPPTTGPSWPASPRGPPRTTSTPSPTCPPSGRPGDPAVPLTARRGGRGVGDRDRGRTQPAELRRRRRVPDRSRPSRPCSRGGRDWPVTKGTTFIRGVGRAPGAVRHRPRRWPVRCGVPVLPGGHRRHGRRARGEGVGQDPPLHHGDRASSDAHALGPVEGAWRESSEIRTVTLRDGSLTKRVRP